ncbi:hypothetical protein GMOD_00000838 [Pyrenophora seminiperda CCB06]|uniref:Uncharacterized protein n=1 Tax=Pyrenophora seminiperda CCB06 TaxID=1302712 RepID=A0A3M7M886_9PLEO|nr:hypothetical protein GMOD_00000838 [Pyrenophora seminiperda CCB06]
MATKQSLDWNYTDKVLTELTENEVTILEAQKMLFPSPDANKRKVSVALLSPPSSDDSCSDSSSPSLSVCFRSFSTNLDRTFDLPTSGESVQGIEFMGFTHDAAVEIYRRWSNRDPTTPDRITDYVLGYTYTLRRKESEDKTIEAALTMAGINSELRAVFQDTRFEQVRQTQPLNYWVEDTIRTNFSALIELYSRLKQSAKLGPSIKQPKRAHFTSSTFVPATPTVHSSVDAEAPARLPDHTMLYKGTSSDTPEGPWRPWIREEEGERLCIISAPYGDFNKDSGAYYFSPEHDTAEMYRQWAEARCPFSES